MTFTAKKPTVPGVYMCKTGATEFTAVVYERRQSLFCDGIPIENTCRLWSSRLVPVEEVELAYKEGRSDGITKAMCVAIDDPRVKNPLDYEQSRARRVVEGKETT